MFATRDGMRNWLQEVATWSAFALMVTATLASLTIVFMPLGMWLFFGGAAVFALGLLLSGIIPRLWRYHPVVCPRCSHLNQVRHKSKRFLCGSCANPVKVRPAQGKGQLIMLLPGRSPARQQVAGEETPLKMQGGDAGV